jgi:predicted AlkP superfamily pyrophosphatase or phosphodiesterase
MAGEKLLIVILDGASADVLERVDTPFLLKQCDESGVGSLRAVAPMPTITYGNHACIMTGRLPGGKYGHGIVGNLFRDPDTRLIVNLDDVSPNDYLQSPTLFELLVRGPFGPRPGAAVAEPISRGAAFTDPMMPYLKLPPLERDIAATRSALGILKNHDINLMVVNFLSVDAAGEIYGPDSAEYRRILEQADAHIRELLIFWQNATSDEVHLLVTADHGMHAVQQLINPAETLSQAGIAAAVAASHRAAHVYLDDENQIAKARDVLGESGAFSEILPVGAQAALALDHQRSGDLILLAAPGVELQKSGLNGSHGAAQPEEVNVPLILGGSRWDQMLASVAAPPNPPRLDQLDNLIFNFFDVGRVPVK